MIDLPPKTKTRVCAHSCVAEQDLPNGQKLLTCGKCGETNYASKQAQKTHWKLHKPYCCAPSNDRMVQGLEKFEQDEPHNWNDYRDYADVIGSALEGVLAERGAPIGRILLHCFQKMYWYFANESHVITEKDEDQQQTIFQFLTAKITLPLLQILSEQIGVSFLWHFFAIPGFADWFLSDDILLTAALRERKDKGEEALSLEDVLAVPDDCDDENSKQNVMCRPYAIVITQFYLLCCFDGLTLDDELGILEDPSRMRSNSPLAAAIARRVMRNAVSPYVVASLRPYGDLRFDMLAYFVQHGVMAIKSSPPDSALNQATNDNEIVPGLTAYHLLKLLIVDLQMYRMADPTKLLQFFLFLKTEYGYRHEDGPFSYITAQERLELLERLHNDAEWEAPLQPIRAAPAMTRRAKQTIQDHLRLSVLTHSSNIHFQLYDKAKTMKTAPPSDKVMGIVTRVRALLVTRSRPLVQLYADILERKMKAQKKKVCALPEDCIQLIAEFASEAAVLQSIY